jgi:uncharacterized membrane protein
LRRSFIKKITALLVALALFASTAFAAPLSVAAEFGYPAPVQTGASSEQVPEAFSAIDETGDFFADALFAGVGGIPLTAAEADQVEGDGAAAVIAAVVVVVIIANTVMKAINTK